MNAIPAPRKARGAIPILSVAPMLDWTDRHYRVFMRKMTRRTLLYSEMVVGNAIIRGDRDRLLAFSDEEHPLSLQLAGDDPETLARCAEIAEGYGYDEVNLNVGCPSDRVQRGRFGAILMAHPDTVAGCVTAMRAATGLAVTVKQRIGLDDHARYEDMLRFVDTVAAAGCDRFIIHARAAILARKLSPKDNRRVPPLRFEEVYRLKRERPELTIEINGEVKTLDDARRHLAELDGVMVGRAAYVNPFAWAEADRLLFGDSAAPPTRVEVVERLLPYAEQLGARAQPIHRLTRHMLGLFSGMPGAGAWRRHLSQNGRRTDGAAVLREALAFMPRSD